ncbi:hypothetical protein TNCV_2975111 [Trichonephila clavipes]|nr:hypothetical protein TNCV_2975111 [Trichonephila clavipes]
MLLDICLLPHVRMDDTLNRARYSSQRYISSVLCDPWLYPLLEPCDTLRFSRIMHDRMLPVLYKPSLIRKMFGCCPSLHVNRSLTKGKYLIQGCRPTGSSPYAINYG